MNYKEAAAHCAGEAECLGRARLGQGRIDEAIQILSAFNKTAASESTVSFREFIPGRKDLVRRRLLFRGATMKALPKTAPTSHRPTAPKRDPTFNPLDIVFNQDREYHPNQTGLDKQQAGCKTSECEGTMPGNLRCGRMARVCVDVRLKRGQMTMAGDVRSTNGWQTL